MLPDQSWHAATEMAHPTEVEAYLVTEIYKALGWGEHNSWRRWLRPFCRHLVRGFVREAANFDQAVVQADFRFAAQQRLERWFSALRVSGAEDLPREGPLVIAANHPGTFDGLAIASVTPRNDLKILAAANPFFRALPHTRRYFIYSTLDTHVRMATIRNVLRHLQAGGALLIFPSGKLDPDPWHFRHAAVEALQRWSGSLELFMRKAPETRLVVAINSGFVAPEYLRLPFIRLRSGDEARQKLAEFIQVISQVVFHRRSAHIPEVIFSGPLLMTHLAQSPGKFVDKVAAIAENLILG